MVLAQEEARLLNHNYIGTEHLLLGLVHEGHGVAAVALESLGISLTEVRAAVEQRTSRGPSEPSGHIPFTPRAKTVLELSMREALQLGHNYIGTEHVLLGLVREGDGVGSQVLAELGVELASVRQRIVELLNGMPGSEPMAARARTGGSGIGGIFEPALNEARRLGDDSVGPEHVVLAALDSNDVAGRVLRSFGLTKEEVLRRIVEMRAEGEQAGPE